MNTQINEQRRGWNGQSKQLLALAVVLTAVVGLNSTPVSATLLLDEHWTDASFADERWNNGDNGWVVTGSGATGYVYPADANVGAELYSPFGAGNYIQVDHTFAPTSSGNVKFVWGDGIGAADCIIWLYDSLGNVAKKLYMGNLSPTYIQDSDSPYSNLVDPLTGIEAHPTFASRDPLFVTLSWDIGTQMVTAVGTNKIHQFIGSSGSVPFPAAVSDISGIGFMSRSTGPGRSDLYFLKLEGNGIVVNGTEITMVPEPTATALVGISGLLFLRRRHGSAGSRLS